MAKVTLIRSEHKKQYILIETVIRFHSVGLEKTNPVDSVVFSVYISSSELRHRLMLGLDFVCHVVFVGI